ncbi:hypothetical protein [Lacticaseibacillus saniviri]|nr:hypothetical protein [Lacticaseibacillus saniviri]MCG4280896.1 hypothetical protein [Lacticaseibacillus saniviri]
MIELEQKMAAKAKEMVAQNRKLHYEHDTYNRLHDGEIHTWTNRDVLADWLVKHQPELIEWED